MPRLNRIIERLEQGRVVFGGGMVPTGHPDDAMAFADLGYDFVIFEMEHEGFDLPGLRTSLQYLLNRQSIVENGLQPAPVPLVRVPPNGREANQWILKQALDTGVYGLVLPHIDTVQDARRAIASCRYPGRGSGPSGERGWWRRSAPRYWGLTSEGYYDASDLWPLDPLGNLFVMPIIESVEGIRNLPAILAEVPGIGGIWAGPGDLSIELGTRGRVADPRVEEGLRRVLQACQDANVPCAAIASAEDVEARIEQGFRIIISFPQRTDGALSKGRAKVG